MKILFYLHHPAQFHLFKHVIEQIKRKYKVLILATKKDILELLLKEKGFKYINVLPKGRKDNKLSIALSLLKQDFKLVKICYNFKPELLIGTSTEITHIGKILGISKKYNVPPEKRLWGSLAATTIAVLKGAHIIRTHDVQETADVCIVTDYLKSLYNN